MTVSVPQVARMLGVSNPKRVRRLVKWYALEKGVPVSEFSTVNGYRLPDDFIDFCRRELAKVQSFSLTPREEVRA